MLKHAIRVGGWSCLIPLTVAGIILAVAYTLAVNAERLEREGFDSLATVLDKSTRTQRRQSSSGGSRTSTTYLIDVTFELQDGTPFRDEAGIAQSDWEAIRVGQTLPVRYVPDDPDLNSLTNGSRSAGALVLSILGGVAGLVGLSLGVYFVRRGNRMAQVATRGTTTQGQIIDMVHRPKANSYFTFRFTDGAGKDRQGQSFPGSRKRFDGLADGQTISVRYDPRQPERGFWVRDLGLPD